VFLEESLGARRAKGTSMQSLTTRTSVAIALVLSIAACQASSEKEPGGRGESDLTDHERDSSGPDADGNDRSDAFPDLPELDAKIAELLTGTPSVPGANVAIVKGGKVAFAKGYGKARLDPAAPMTADTIVNVASISKVVTALAVMRLVDQGKIGLDADLQPVLGFALRNPQFADVPITLRMLLSHTSSINSRSDSMTAPIEENWVENADASISLETFVGDTFTPGKRWYSTEHYHPSRPGTKFDYCNICPAISAFIVEKVSHKAFDAFSKQEIFEPLGMTSTTWRLALTNRDRLAVGYSAFSLTGEPLPTPEAVPPQGAPYYPATSLRTTSIDLGRFLLEFSTKHAVIKAESANEMFREQFPGVAPGQGLGWYSHAPSIFGHNGSDAGHSANMSLDIRNGTGVLVMLNGDGGDDGETPLYSKIEKVLWDAAEKL
jgi:CubicO group peptidase (beta-lactamase class C family)